MSYYICLYPKVSVLPVVAGILMRLFSKLQRANPTPVDVNPHVRLER